MLRTDLTALHVISTPHRRGAEQVAHGLATHLEPHGIRSTIVALAGAPGPASLDIAVLGRTRNDVRGMVRLVALARRHDVLIAHGGNTLWPTVLAALPRRPVIYRNIGDPEYWAGSTMRRLRVGPAMRKVHSIVALYQGAAEWMSAAYGIERDRFTVIPNSVDDAHFTEVGAEERRAARERHGIPVDAKVVAFVGALSPEKRPDLAVEVAERLGDVHLLIAGDGPLRESVMGRARRVGARVHVLGPVADARPIYAAADVLVVPSETEGLPGVLLESLLCGTPVVATAVGGIPELLTPEMGRVVGHDVAEITDAVDELATARRRVGPDERAAVQASHSFGRGDVVQRWADTIRRTQLDRGDRASP